jgi:hypothetical protein
MAIDELTALVAPPESPSEVPERPGWKAIEKRLGVHLPSDYKEYVTTYGSGLLGNFIIVASPFSAHEGVELFSVIEMSCTALRERKENEGEEGVPFAIFPEESGLLPWGGDENGNGLYWLTEGAPDHWPCLVGAGRDRRWQRFDMPMSSFLAKVLSGDVKCKIWPPAFARPRRRRVFTPY